MAVAVIGGHFFGVYLNKWYLTPGQALDPFFRGKPRGIEPHLLVHRSGTRRWIKGKEDEEV